MRRSLALGVVAALVLTGGVLAAGLLASELDDGPGPANATVTEFEPRVAVDEDDWRNATEGEGVQTCVSVGPPPGSYGLTGSLVVERPIDDDGPDEATFRTGVALADGVERHERNLTLRRGESERIRLFDVGRNDGALAAGEGISVRVRVYHDGVAVANATRTVEVRESGELDCDGETAS